MIGGRLLTLALLTAVCGGCSSQWYLQHDQTDLVTTNVVIRTDPSGASVATDGVSHGASPVRIPIEYNHTEQFWSRQQNHGATMREGMNPIVQVLTFPVWGIASFFHYREDRRRHVYANNVIQVSARKGGYHDAREEIVLEGQDEIPVFLGMDKR